MQCINSTTNSRKQSTSSYNSMHQFSDYGYLLSTCKSVDIYSKCESGKTWAKLPDKSRENERSKLFLQSVDQHKTQTVFRWEKAIQANGNVQQAYGVHAPLFQNNSFPAERSQHSGEGSRDPDVGLYGLVHAGITGKNMQNMTTMMTTMTTMTHDDNNINTNTNNNLQYIPGRENINKLELKCFRFLIFFYANKKIKNKLLNDDFLLRG